MSNFAGGIGGAAQNLPVDDEARADAGSEGEEDEVLEVRAAFTDAEMKLGQCAGVSIVLDEDRDVWERFTKRAVRLGRSFDALENASVRRAFNAGRFGAADVKVENRLREHRACLHEGAHDLGTVETWVEMPTVQECAAGS